MPLIEWNDSIKIGLWTIDIQHEHWVSLMNVLHEAMLRGRGKDVLEKTLAEAINYTRTHFSEEEALMREHQYSKYDQHKALHEAFLTELLDLQDKHQRSLVPISIQVMNSMKHWLVSHIRGADRAYAKLLKSKGIF